MIIADTAEGGNSHILAKVRTSCCDVTEETEINLQLKQTVLKMWTNYIAYLINLIITLLCISTLQE